MGNLSMWVGAERLATINYLRRFSEYITDGIGA